MQTFLSLVMVILIVVAALWLRSRIFGLGNRRPEPVRPTSADPAYLNELEYERLTWELERRGFQAGDPSALRSDFYFADQLAVEAEPAGVDRFLVNVRNGRAGLRPQRRSVWRVTQGDRRFSLNAAIRSKVAGRQPSL